MLGADAMVKCLEEEGVKYVFGYPGWQYALFITVYWIPKSIRY